MNATRRFQVGKDRALTLPAELDEGTANTRLTGGDIVELEVCRINGGRNRPPFGRFINRCLTNGDLVELADEPAKVTTKPAPTPSSPNTEVKS